MDLLENCSTNQVLVAVIRAIAAVQREDMFLAKRELELVMDAGEVQVGTKLG